MVLPAGLSAFAVRAASALPDRVLRIALPKRLGFRLVDELAIQTPPDSAVKVFIGPVNFAGQGWQWARAVERTFPDVTAVSMAYSVDGGFSFPVDEDVPAATYLMSRAWQSRQKARIESQFTHVILEAGRHLFGDVYRESVADEIRTLRDSGVQVALLTHGSDMRDPRRHVQNHEFSPLDPAEWPMAARLQEEARRNRALLDEVGASIFVSTPGMLDDVPEGTWLPVVVDPRDWHADRSAFNDVPVVLHAPSNPVIKGTPLIEPVLHALEAEGLIRYERLIGVPSAQMPERIAGADIVLDQFRLGDYGVAACEAMASARIVVGNVAPSVRDFVRRSTGRALPIVQADPATIDSVLRDILADRERYRAVADEGPGFVSVVHDGRWSAHALASFFGVTTDTAKE